MLQRIDEIQHSRRRYLASLNVSKLIRFLYLNINLDIFSISDVLHCLAAKRSLVQYINLMLSLL